MIAESIKHSIDGFRIINRNISIISNNCLGADICHSLGLRFNSPTVNLQILPCHFVRFVSNLKHYLKYDPVEVTFVDDDLERQVDRTYHRCSNELQFPIGIVDDIPIFFQHYKSFEEGRTDWNRRKERIAFDNLGFILIGDEEFRNECLEFDRIQERKKLVFSINYDLKLQHTKVIRVDCPPGKHFMDKMGFFGKKYYEQRFNAVKWINER